ncbi:MAG: GGDEF domain-containing protein [Acidobacteriota bacterium]
MTTEKTIITIPSGTRGSREEQNACVVQIYGDDLGKRYAIKDEVTIGRCETNTIAVNVPNVSRKHARIFLDQGRCRVEDLGSTNGTHVNDVEIEHIQSLSNGDLITTGGLVFKFIVGGNIEALYHEEIYRLTILDGLTGVHNKRFFSEFLERELARARRHSRPLSVALLDLDHFKKVNDTYGHLAGDTTLKRVAHVIEERVRRDELLARYGGEEFAVVLPETDLQGALIFGEMIRRQVEDSSFSFDQQDIRVTVSVGIAALGPDDDADALIREADTQLYRAKSAGRNRVFPEAGRPER